MEYSVPLLVEFLCFVTRGGDENKRSGAKVESLFTGRSRPLPPLS